MDRCVESYAAALDDHDDIDGFDVVCEYTLPLATALAAKRSAGCYAQKLSFPFSFFSILFF